MKVLLHHCIASFDRMVIMKLCFVFVRFFSDLEQLRKIRRRSPHDDTEAFTVFLRSDVEAKYALYLLKLVHSVVFFVPCLLMLVVLWFVELWRFGAVWRPLLERGISGKRWSNSTKRVCTLYHFFHSFTLLNYLLYQMFPVFHVAESPLFSLSSYP